MPICAYCYAPFTSRNKRRIYCSEKCRRDADNERRREQRAEAAEMRAVGYEDNQRAHDEFLESEKRRFRSQCDSCKWRDGKNKMACFACREGINV